MASTVIFIPLIALSALAGIIDLVRYRVPNWISLALVGTFVVALCPALSISEVLWRLVFAAAVFLASFFVWLRGMIGGGDQKLLSAIALWLGFTSEFAGFITTTALVGGILALIVVTLRSAWLSFCLARFPKLTSFLTQIPNKVPYAPAMALGVLAVFWP